MAAQPFELRMGLAQGNAESPPVCRRESDRSVRFVDREDMQFLSAEKTEPR